MSGPGGFSNEGLPIGVQLLGAHFQEQHLFNAGTVIEEAAGIKELPNVLR
jgi:aspartyl-tRNA(Asn)/glutamyl-tRNA(Gln) amidotransferase subunit A